MRKKYRSPGSAESPRQDKLIKLKKIKEKEKILKATNNIQGNPHKVIS